MSDAVARDGTGDLRAGALAAAQTGRDDDRGALAGSRVDAPGGRRSRLRPVVVAAVLAVLFLAAAWIAARRGIVTDTWPAFLPGTDSTSITRYSGPWLTAAAAAVLGAGLSIMALVRGLIARTAR